MITIQNTWCGSSLLWSAHHHHHLKSPVEDNCPSWLLCSQIRVHTSELQVQSETQVSMVRSSHIGKKTPVLTHSWALCMGKQFATSFVYVPPPLLEITCGGQMFQLVVMFTDLCLHFQATGLIRGSGVHGKAQTHGQDSSSYTLLRHYTWANDWWLADQPAWLINGPMQCSLHDCHNLQKYGVVLIHISYWFAVLTQLKRLAFSPALWVF